MKVVVGVSGGVDSAVCAYLLKKQGYDVYCAYIRMMDADSEMADAEMAAALLGLPFRCIDYRIKFRNCVIGGFVDEYIIGRTPNPCIICNRDAKWSAMLDFADEIGAKYVATGHYAKIEKLDNGRYTISNSQSAKKDQTYVLCYLTQEMLSKTLMPLGDYTKEKIREIAKEIGLNVANKADSQDICFIPDNNHFRYLSENVPERMHGTGSFLDESGNVVGYHKGVEAYTIGQRKGLNLAMGHPVYVSKINAEENTVTISDTDVYSNEMSVTDVFGMGMELSEIFEDIKYTVRVRYAHRGEEGSVKINTTKRQAQVTFDNPVRAITPGQAAVFYLNGKIMFSGTIS